MTPEIHVAATLFGPIPGVDPRDAKDTTILIESSQPEEAAQALARAAAAFINVAEDGQIIASDEQMLENELSPRPLYTPSYVSPVYRSEHGPFVLIDANHHIPPGMARTFIRLVSDELKSAGVTRAMLSPAPSITSPQDLQVWVDYEPLT